MSPFPPIVLSSLCVIAFPLGERESVCLETSNFLPRTQKPFCSCNDDDDINQTHVKSALIFYFCGWEIPSLPLHVSLHLSLCFFGSVLQRQVTGIGGAVRQWECVSGEKSHMSAGRKNCYLLHHYLVQWRDALRHGQMSVCLSSACPAGKVQVAKKMSQAPGEYSPG